MKRLLFFILIALLGFYPAFAGNFYRNIKVVQAYKLITEHQKDSAMTILDVRTPGEFRKGYVAGAVNIDFWGREFDDLVEKLDKSRIYLVYCTSGVRSRGAMKKMRRLGFGKIYNVRGGMFSWRAAGLPVVNNNK